MSLILNIQRQEGDDTQVRCLVDGVLVKEFYSFGDSFSDSVIDANVRADLQVKGYSI